MKKILVTGTAGFIGFHLVQKLKDAEYEIIGLDDINDYYDVDLKYARLAQTGIEKNSIVYGKLTASKTIASYKFIQANVNDKETISRLFQQQQFDAVIHLAAQAGVRYSLINPFAYTESNVTGFLNILEGCRSVKTKHLVFASTSSVYGLNTNMPLSEHESAEHPVSLYAATKKANEMMAHSYSYLFDLPVTGVRFFSVYGPWGRPDMALFIFTKAILNNQPIQVFNNGEMIRDFTYVEDIAEALKKILEKPATKNNNWDAKKPDPASSSSAYRIVNIGNAAPVKLIDYITAIEEYTGKKAVKEMMPMQPGDVAATSADVTELINNYSYKPATNIKDGVRKFVEWFRDFYKL